MMMVAKGLSPLRESPPPGESGAEAWAAVEGAGAAADLQHTQRSSSVDAMALRGRLQNLKVRQRRVSRLQLETTPIEGSAAKVIVKISESERRPIS